MSLYAVAPGDRNVSWLAQCSSDWCFKPIKYLCALNSSVLSESTSADTEIKYIDIGSVNSDGTWVASEPMIFREAPSRARRILTDGDVLISTVRTYLRAIAHVEKVNEFLICSTGFAVLRAGKAVDSRFLAYWVRSKLFVDEIVSRSVGVSYPAINALDIGNLPFPVLPLSEQCAIAAFLDRITSKIDALINKKEELIELLQEKRAALISHVVTKGLDPKVPIKNAGIKYLENIPRNWEVKKLKFVVSFYGGGTPSKGNFDYWTGDIPWVSPKDMKSEFITDTEDHITEEAVMESATCLIQPGAVLLVVRSGILRHTIPVAVNVRPVALNQDMKALVPKMILQSSYLKYLIIGLQRILLVMWRKEGATVESIEFEFLANTSIPVPPIVEQKEISIFLDHELEKLDSLISKIHLAVEKLREYRTALISAAVTGKIDVRQELA